MINHRVNIIMDAQWGSSGKGKFAAWLAEKCDIPAASTSNGPNAGHSVVRNGRKTVFKVLPAATAAPCVDYAFLTGASVFDPNRIWQEDGYTGAQTIIHERAVVLTPEHAAHERHFQPLRALASTMQGTGVAMCDKIMRQPVIARERHEKELPGVVADPSTFARTLDRMLAAGPLLHEVAQGYALSIDHGSHYPECTSRNCTTAKALDDLGVSPRRLGDVYLNLRPYPIRVGHLIEDDELIGHSGGFYPDCREITWEEVGQRAGMPEAEVAALAERERTTVTKRIRRVSTFSWQGLAEAVRANGANKLILNFAQYLDWSIRDRSGETTIDELPPRVRHFVLCLEAVAGVPVVLIGTGEEHDAVLEVCR